jgi:hypothetical protein
MPYVLSWFPLILSIVAMLLTRLRRKVLIQHLLSVTQDVGREIVVIVLFRCRFDKRKISQSEVVQIMVLMKADKVHALSKVFHMFQEIGILGKKTRLTRQGTFDVLLRQMRDFGGLILSDAGEDLHG